VVRRWHSCPEKLGCPIPGGAPGQAGWGPGQPQLVVAALPMARGWGGVGCEVLSNPNHSVILTLLRIQLSQIITFWRPKLIICLATTDWIKLVHLPVGNMVSTS